MTAATTTGETPAPALAGARLMLTVLLSAMFMAQFDFFVVNVAAPSLERDLGAGQGVLELIVGGYAFAYAGALITGGRLGDLLGHRRLFVWGTVGFALTSLACGLAGDGGQLVAARLAQGLSAALMIPQVLALITATFPPAVRPRALAWYGVAIGLGSIAGQVLGGLLIRADVAGLGWRVIFLINVPIAAVVAPLALRVLPEPPPRARAPLDPLGAVGISAALALVLVPLTLGRTEGWPAWTWISMAAALPVALATLRWERLLGRRGGAPVLELSLLGSPSFVAGLAAGSAFMFVFASFMFTLTLLLQGGLRLDAFEAGLAFSPMGVLFAVSALYGRGLIARHGLRVVVLGSLLVVAGLGVLVARLETAGGDVGVAWIVPALGVVGFGNGFVLPSLIGAALVAVRPQHAGAASGIFTTVQQFSSAAGVAVVGTIFFAVLDRDRPTIGIGGYFPAMEWAAGIDAVLAVVVTALVVVNGRIGARERAAREAAGASAVC